MSVCIYTYIHTWEWNGVYSSVVRFYFSFSSPSVRSCHCVQPLYVCLSVCSCLSLGVLSFNLKLTFKEAAAKYLVQARDFRVLVCFGWSCICGCVYRGYSHGDWK